MEEELNIENKALEQLVFVIGAGRSGTTLLMNMLNQHTAIIAPPEHDFLMSSLYKFGNKAALSDRDIEEYVDSLWNRKMEFAQLWNLNSTQLKEDLKASSRDFETVFVKTLKAYDQNKNATVVMDKNPYYTAHIDLLRKQFPDAKFVAVIRDVRDRLVSIKRNESKVFRNNIIRSAKWSDFNRDILKLKASDADHVFVLKYEELVLETTQVLTDLCKYLKVPFEKEMLDFDQKQRMKLEGDGIIIQGMNTMHAGSDQKINKGKIGQWKNVLTEEELKSLSFFCGEVGESLGYKDFAELSDGEKRQIQKQFKMAIFKGRTLWRLKGLSYKMPFWSQRSLAKMYRKLINK